MIKFLVILWLGIELLCHAILAFDGKSRSGGEVLVAMIAAVMFVLAFFL